MRRGCDGGAAATPGGGRRGCRLRAALQRPQALLELPVAVLQFLVLAGELAQPVLEPLDPHLRIGIIGLCANARASDSSEHRGNRRGAGNS